jgi:hypothetical protein
MVTGQDIVQQRLVNQRLIGPPFRNLTDSVAYFGAVQAQDYPAAQWAVGQRTQDATAAAVEQAFDTGQLLRTHVMRPTWHFVTPPDIRWLLALTAPRVNLAAAYNYRRLGLDETVFAASRGVLEGTLMGGKQLTRDELGAALARAGLATDGLRLSHLVMRAELDGVICSGARRGKQMTYALLEERVPPAGPLTRDEALAELARRYFRSHGPATDADYAWWSGLTLTDARAGLEMVKGQLERVECEGEAYWLARQATPADDRLEDDGPCVHLLPNYDEYIVGYTDREAVIDPARVQAPDARGNVLFNYIMVFDGGVVGTWKRTPGKGGVTVAFSPFNPLSAAVEQAFATEAARYAAFLGLPLVLAA